MLWCSVCVCVDDRCVDIEWSNSNGTLKSNVLMGRAFDAERWREVVEATALAADLEQLRGGEFCEIGEKGVTLSGGQRQRVSLARAAYRPGAVTLVCSFGSSISPIYTLHDLGLLLF
jgi:ATP-binding cassette subfamily C (CFTR/MRP) protein 1